MEWWSGGETPTTPPLHHSITPSLHHSITPSLRQSRSSLPPSPIARPCAPGTSSRYFSPSGERGRTVICESSLMGWIALSSFSCSSAYVPCGPTRPPIDCTLSEGANKGKMQLGIYELDGDTVKFCFAAPGKDRPTDFTTKPGDTRVLSVWKKEKE